MPQKKNEGEVIECFKAFDQNMQCRGFRFEIGKTYEHKGKVALCESGFHAVEFPMDALTYYSDTFAKVTLAGVTDEKRGDSKRVGSKITINAKLSFADLIKAQIAIVKEKAAGNIATGYYGHAAATGYYGHAAATGDYGHAAATGYSGHAAATGDYGHAAATGDYGHAAATGDSGHAAATGNSGHAAATGYSGHAAATGNSGCAFAGFGGTAKASKTGAFAIAWFDAKAKRARMVCGIPGENGIEADTFYRVNDSGELEPA